MKQITLNVDINFTVPDDYEVTDMETVEFKGQVGLFDGSGNLVKTENNPRHTSIETREGS